MSNEQREVTPGERIATLRVALGRERGRRLTQHELAAEVGVSRGTVAAWETDVQQPSGENLVRLASTLGASPDYILSGLDPELRSVWERSQIMPGEYYAVKGRDGATVAGIDGFKELAGLEENVAAGAVPSAPPTAETPLSDQWLWDLGLTLSAASFLLAQVNEQLPPNDPGRLARHTIAGDLQGFLNQIGKVLTSGAKQGEPAPGGS